MNFLNSIQNIINDASSSIQSLSLLGEGGEEPAVTGARMERRRSTLFVPTPSPRSSRSPSPSIRTNSRSPTGYPESRRPSGVPLLPTFSPPTQGLSGRFETKVFPLASKSPLSGLNNPVGSGRQRGGSLAENPFKGKFKSQFDTPPKQHRSESICVSSASNLVKPRIVLPVFKETLDKWPENQGSGSGVKFIDDGYFEKFGCLIKNCIKRDMEHLEKADEILEVSEKLDAPLLISLPKSELQQLYIEVLYTIQHKLGANSTQYNHIKDELLQCAQEAFGVNKKLHEQLMNVASDEKPPIVILNVLVVEAEGLEAKDANGFSDPYCMLGIRPGLASAIMQATSSSSRPGLFSQMSTDTGYDPHSFRDKLSFRRKENSPILKSKFHSGGVNSSRNQSPERRNSAGLQLPAKYIRATSVKPATLNPVWEEKFRFDIDDPNSDCLHLDIWDHDDDMNVIEAVGKLNQVKGVKGMRRFFKQIAQSARGGDQDDFLGCITLSVQDIPSTGVDNWYKLSGRSSRSQVQGSIHLKIWLSTREDRGLCEEESTVNELHQQFQLYTIFISHKLATLKDGLSCWDGLLSQAANTILHQHAIQGDINDLQTAVVRWKVLLCVAKGKSIDMEIMYTALRNIEQRWDKFKLSTDEEADLGSSFLRFIEGCLDSIKDVYTHFPPHHRNSRSNLEYTLRCLYQLSEMRAFSSCCPFSKEIRGEVVLSIKKGVTDRFRGQVQNAEGEEGHSKNRIDIVSTILLQVITDLELASNLYDKIFDSILKVHYTATVFKQINRLVCERLYPILSEICQEEHTPDETDFDGGLENQIKLFQLCYEFRRFEQFGEGLSKAERKGLHLNRFQEYFVPTFNRWLDTAKPKLMERVEKSIEMDELAVPQLDVQYTTSAFDMSSTLCQIKELWSSLRFTYSENLEFLQKKLSEMLYEAIQQYCSLTHNRLENSGFYEQSSISIASEQMCTAINNLEHVYQHFKQMGTELSLIPVGSSESQDNQEFSETLGPLQEALECLDSTIFRILSKIPAELGEGLKRHVFHLAWSPDTLPMEDAISPLLAYLNSHLTSLNTRLLAGNFRRSLLVLWETLLDELKDHTDTSTGERMPLFYDRLHEGLQILSEYFLCDGRGLDHDVIFNQIYRHIDLVFGYAKLSTADLINEYYKERLNDQYSIGVPEFGVLVVRVYFRHDNLSIEILSARDVIPLDPNGLSDPFVNIELLPRNMFPKCPKLETAVQKATLNPTFDETFEFNLRREQCREQGAVICFTLMDYDVITANDFGGEAYIALSSVPGVEQGSSSVDNFHGLKPIHLPLMFQKNKEHPILSTLETRKNDKAAQEFLKRQKFRIQE